MALRLAKTKDLSEAAGLPNGHIRINTQIEFDGTYLFEVKKVVSSIIDEVIERLGNEGPTNAGLQAMAEAAVLRKAARTMPNKK